MRKMVKKAYIFKEDAAEIAAELKGGLKQVSGKGIIAAGKTAKDAAGAASGASKSAKQGIGSQACAGLRPGLLDRGRRRQGRVRRGRQRLDPGQEHGDRGHDDRRPHRHPYTGKVKTAVGKVKQKFTSGLSTTKGEMDAHAAKVQGGTQKIPGDNQGKVSQGQAKVNAEATKEPEKPKGLLGKIVSAAKWIAEKLKAAFKFIAQLLTDPGFWVSLIVAIALTAFVIATFGSGLAVLVVAGAVIGAISAGAGQITSNLAPGKSWNEGLGTAMLVGGAFGAIPGVGSVLGKVGGAVARKIAPTIASSFAGQRGPRVASSAFGRGVSRRRAGREGPHEPRRQRGPPAAQLRAGPRAHGAVPHRREPRYQGRQRDPPRHRQRARRPPPGVSPATSSTARRTSTTSSTTKPRPVDDLSQAMAERGFRGKPSTWSTTARTA